MRFSTIASGGVPAVLATVWSASALAQLSLPSTVSTPIDWNWAYEAGTTGASLKPDELGAIQAPLGTPMSSFTNPLTGFTSESAASGIYNASTINGNQGAYFSASSWNSILQLNSDVGYTMEWMLKVNDLDTVEANSAMNLFVEDGRSNVNRGWNLALMKNSSGQYRVQLGGASTNVSANISQNVYNRIRVTVRNNAATLFLNSSGTAVGTVSGLSNLNTNAVEFGDFTSSGDSSYSVDFLRFYDGGAIPNQENLYPHHVYSEPGTGRKFRLAYASDVVPESQAGYQGHKIWYQVSTDGGSTYDTIRPLIQQGAAYSAVHPIAPVYAGLNDFVASSFAPPTRVSNGEILVPFDISPLNAAGTGTYNPYGATSFHQTGVLIGKWNSANTDIEWNLGGMLSLDSQISSRGLNEGAVVELNSAGRIMLVARGSNENNTSAASHKWKAVSEDYGRTWSPVTELTYSDGSSFFSPSAMSDIRKHSVNGKIYWFGNIIPNNATGNSPRYPLVIAEVDPSNLGIIANTVTTIGDYYYVPGSPYFDTTQVQFSNFTVVEDPTTHNYLVSLYRFDPGKSLTDPGAYQQFTVVINPEPGVIGLAACAGLLLRRRFHA